MSKAPNRAHDTARQPELSFTAHRGVFVPEDMYSSHSGAGTHWSASQRTAEEMASYAQAASPSKQGHQIIHHGSIPMSSVEDNPDVLKAGGVLGGGKDLNNNSEKEIPVKKGATVHVTSRTKATKRNGVWKTRERNYKPARKVSA